MCKAKKKQIDWSTDALMNWIKVVAHRSVGGGSCSRRVVGVRAFRRFLLSAHLFRTFSLSRRSLSKSTRPSANYFTSLPRHFVRALLSLYQPDN